ncbi:MAG: hypothetical protein CMA31_02875 [Euryarchaeota archaeon]|nr:hypothetical protein [Euryarchaeota archaeon]|tara:strand:+ start:503 stop:1027 length:525 start_codon:yes stop_codon:yes gene_type:complete
MNSIQVGTVRIIDKWMDTDFIDHLADQFLYKYPHYFVESSLNKGPTMYSHDFTPGNTLIDFLTIKLQKQFGPEYGELGMTRVYFNIAHPGMDGDFHVDSKDPNAGPSIMLMVTPKGEGGAFYYKPDPNDNLCIEEVEYEQNRLLIFNAGMEHYGKSFTNTPRITLVFKTYVEPK